VQQESIREYRDYEFVSLNGAVYVPFGDLSFKKQLKSNVEIEFYYKPEVNNECPRYEVVTKKDLLDIHLQLSGLVESSSIDTQTIHRFHKYCYK
jgi:hypothetical protein